MGGSMALHQESIDIYSRNYFDRKAGVGQICPTPAFFLPLPHESNSTRSADNGRWRKLGDGTRQDPL